MHRTLSAFALTLLIGLLPGHASAGRDHDDDDAGRKAAVQLGPRPFFLVSEMTDGPLKQQLQQCAAKRKHYERSDFSIGHRGAPLQFPEHTVESYEAAARMGAGVIECDVTFTKDKQLVCRHAQNDLHTTTNILSTPLAATCIKPFTPASFDAAGRLVSPASAECRTSEITLAEFRTLRGKMDAANPRARSVAEYLAGTAAFRTDLYSGPTSGTLMTHRESIELFKRLGVKMTPELKSPAVTMPFDGFTQQDYAQKMIDEYKQARVPARDVWPQSFDRNDVLYWVNAEPAFGRQAVLPGRRGIGGRAARCGRVACHAQTGHPHLGAADLRADLCRRQWQPACVAGRTRRPRRRAGPDHLVARALGHPGRRQQRLLLPDLRQCDPARGRPVPRDRRAGQGGRCAGHLQRLGRPGHVLCQLRRTEVGRTTPRTTRTGAGQKCRPRRRLRVRPRLDVIRYPISSCTVVGFERHSMFKDPSLAGRRILITAGAGGIGLQIARGFVESGARVLVADLDADAVERVRSELPGLQACVADVSDEASVVRLLETCDATLGGLDVLINNAGIAGPTGTVDQLELAEVRRTLEVNLLSQFSCVKHALPRLRKGHGACIVNLSSAAGHLGMPGRSAYSASKWAVVGFTKSISLELGREGIRVNAVLPGAVDGPRIRAVIAAKAASQNKPLADVAQDYEQQSALGRMVTAEDIANTVLFACSDLARSITGQELVVDGHTQALS